jgi:hypothetical protein
MFRNRTNVVRSTMSLILAAGAMTACADSTTAPRTAAMASVAPAVAASTTDGTLNSGSGSFAYTDRVNVTIPSLFAVQNFCAGGRFGEIVVFQGDQHLVFTQTTTADGHVNLLIHWNAEGITGVGQYTGFTYRATGVTADHTVSNIGFPYTGTFINNYHVIGQGQATNGDLHEVVHFTVNANGDFVADVSDYNFTCKGTPSF